MINQEIELFEECYGSTDYVAALYGSDGLWQSKGLGVEVCTKEEGIYVLEDVEVESELEKKITQLEITMAINGTGILC